MVISNFFFNKRTRRYSGFTFLEIMLVVVIIGLLLSIAGPRLVGKKRRAQIETARFQIASFKTALGAYEMDVGSFPMTSQGLAALLQRPPDVPEEDWHGPYLDKIPKDPWHEDYIYRSPGEHNPDYDLFSKGPDRQEGTSDDIVSWATDSETGTSRR